MTTRGRVACGAGALIGIALALAAGCSVVTSYDGYTPDGPPCGKRFPDPPAASAGKTGPERLGMLTFLQFLDQPNTERLGYDLDNLCTCPDVDARPCRNPNAGGDLQCDFENTGIDNAAGSILSVLFPPEANDRIQDTLRHGKNGLVVRVREWDGTADDASVNVAIFNVVGLKGDEDGAHPAKFDGNDELVVDEQSLLNVPDLGPKYFSASAYVTKGKLVAALPEYDFRIEVSTPLGTNVVAIPLRQAHLVGTIQKVGTGGVRILDGQLVGRLPVEDIFRQISGIGLCRADPPFADIKKRTCAALDLPLTTTTGRSTKLTCNALSFAIGTKIEPAKIAGSLAVPITPSRCGEEPPERCQ
jgi:hypothetical protein